MEWRFMPKQKRLIFDRLLTQFLDFCLRFASACKNLGNVIFIPCVTKTEFPFKKCRNTLWKGRWMQIRMILQNLFFMLFLLLGSLARQIDVQGEGLTQHWCLSDTVRATSVWTAEKKAQCQEVCSFLCSDSQCLSWGECHDFQTPNKNFDTD